jgi:hypothetical protein
MNPPSLPLSSSPAQTLRRSSEKQSGPPEWHIPNYNGNDNHDEDNCPSANANDGQWPAVPPHLTGEASHASIIDEHRDSDATLYNVNNPDSQAPGKGDTNIFTVSSTSDNPYAPRPSTQRRKSTSTAAPDIPALPFRSVPRRSANFADDEDGMPAAVDETDVDPKGKEFSPEQRRERRGILTHLHHYDGTMRFPQDEFDDEVQEKEEAAAGGRLLHRMGSGDSIGSDVLPERSPIGVFEGNHAVSKAKGRVHGKDPKDVEFNRVARLPYKLRRKEQKQPTIEHQITCELSWYLFSVSICTDSLALSFLCVFVSDAQQTGIPAGARKSPSHIFSAFPPNRDSARLCS